MKTLLLSLLCLFVWSQTTEALTDQQVVLGQNVTLACEFNLKAIIWFVTTPPARPEIILRTYRSTIEAQYNNKFISKYSEGGWSRLVINHVSDDDLGIYYCIKPGWDLEISDGIRLQTAEMSQDDSDRTRMHTTEMSEDDSNHTRLHTTESPKSHNEPEQKHPPQDQTTPPIPIIIFSLLTVVLFAVVIGLLMMNYKLSKKIPKYVNAHQISTMKFRECHRGKTDPVYLEVLPN